MMARVEVGSAEMVEWKADSSGISCMVAMVLIVYVVVEAVVKRLWWITDMGGQWMYNER
jgi:hypothetical protein